MRMTEGPSLSRLSPAGDEDGAGSLALATARALSGSGGREVELSVRLDGAEVTVGGSPRGPSSRTTRRGTADHTPGGREGQELRAARSSSRSSATATEVRPAPGAWASTSSGPVPSPSSEPEGPRSGTRREAFRCTRRRARASAVSSPAPRNSPLCIATFRRSAVGPSTRRAAKARCRYCLDASSRTATSAETASGMPLGAS